MENIRLHNTKTESNSPSDEVGPTKGRLSFLIIIPPTHTPPQADFT